MTLDQAEELFRTYSELLCDPEKRGARRSPALLPAPKPVLMCAFRLLIARLYSQGLDTPDELRQLIEPAMFLDSFNHEALDSLKFLSCMESRKTELLDFHQQLTALSRNDPFFWQRIYGLLGVTSDTKRGTLIQQITSFLRRSPGSPPTPQAPGRSGADRVPDAIPLSPGARNGPESPKIHSLA